MNHYLDITLLPDTEFPASVLMNSLFAKLHKTLCDLHSTSIGISFPRSQLTIGNLLRIHGTEGDLASLNEINWLGGMSGYCKVSAVASVPAGVKFRTVSRKRQTMSQSKLRRLAKRGSITEGEVKRYKIKMLETGLAGPYLELVSGSTGQKYRRYIELGEPLALPVTGKFDQFGLSDTATVPWFD